MKTNEINNENVKVLAKLGVDSKDIANIYLQITEEGKDISKNTYIDNLTNMIKFFQSRNNDIKDENKEAIFKEDVRNYLDSQEIIYTPDFISKGITGLEFNFDFQIAKKDREIVIKSFNTINKQNIPNFLFSWEDIKPVREKLTKKNINAIAIINDLDKEIKTEFLEALKTKNANYILWSERDSEESKKLLSA